MNRSCRCDRCLFCRRWFGLRHEHDHFPVPRRHFGMETVPACRDCHDLRDRVPIERWPETMLAEAQAQLGDDDLLMSIASAATKKSPLDMAAVDQARSYVADLPYPASLYVAKLIRMAPGVALPEIDPDELGEEVWG